jgi:Zn-dependent metalloprotease
MNCIVPPHILRKLLESKDRQLRASALRSLLISGQIRAQRTILAGLPAVTSGGGRRRTIYDARNGEPDPPTGVRVRGEGDPPSKDPAVNDAYDGLGTTYDFYKTVLCRNSLDGKGMRLDAIVHYGEGFDNAFWDGQRMVFGDGDGELFTGFTGALDVIAHELTHGVTEFTAGLEYHNQSGALNESVSDVFGSLVKQWKLGQDAASADWLIGESIFTPGLKGDALRSLKAPGDAYDNTMFGKDPQPRHMDGYQSLPDTRDGDWGGVHINSGIPNHAFYLAAIGIGGNAWEAAGRIWYETLTRHCGPEAQFQTFADATVAVAGRLYGSSSLQQSAVREAWRTVGIAVEVAVSTAPRPAPAPSPYNGHGGSLEQLEDQLAALAVKVDRLEKSLAIA